MFAFWCLYLLLPVFGIPLFAIGVVMRLCEMGWQKPAGQLGSLKFLAVGLLLCLPLLIYLGPLVIVRIVEGR